MQLEWKDKYGCYSAYVGNGWYLRVNYHATRDRDAPEHPDGPFKIYALGVPCKKRAKTVNEGQRIAVVFARLLLNDTLKRLE